MLLAMKKFQQRYGVIKTCSDKKVFTNSIHVPVWKDMNPSEKIDIESELTGLQAPPVVSRMLNLMRA